MSIFARLVRGFGYLTLGPSSRLRRLREESERSSRAGPFGPLPPLPDSAYPPGAVPLDMSGVRLRQGCPRGASTPDPRLNLESAPRLPLPATALSWSQGDSLEDSR